MNVVADASRLERRISVFVKTDIPKIKALTNGVLARDTKDRLNREIQSIFDSPVRFVATAIGVIKKSTSRSPDALIGPKDVFGGKNAAAKASHGELGGALKYILEPHIFGGARRQSPTEWRLRQIGVIGKNEWIIPARGAKVRPSEYFKMLVHFKAFREGGFTTTRSPGSRRRRRRPSAYDIQWIGNKLKGIFRMNERGRGKLLWIVTQSEPRYNKKFRYFEIIDDNVKRKKEKIGNWAKRKVLRGG